MKKSHTRVVRRKQSSRSLKSLKLRARVCNEEVCDVKQLNNPIPIKIRVRTKFASTEFILNSKIIQKGSFQYGIIVYVLALVRTREDGTEDRSLVDQVTEDDFKQHRINSFLSKILKCDGTPAYAGFQRLTTSSDE